MTTATFTTTRRIYSQRLRGWTFVETLVVIGIILILTSAVGFMAFKYIDQAKQATAKSQVETLALALSSYYIDCKQYPDPQTGLAALWEEPSGAELWNGPYVAKAIPKDPWNHDYTPNTGAEWPALRGAELRRRWGRGPGRGKCGHLLGEIGCGPSAWSTRSWTSSCSP